MSELELDVRTEAPAQSAAPIEPTYVISFNTMCSDCQSYCGDCDTSGVCNPTTIC